MGSSSVPGSVEPQLAKVSGEQAAFCKKSLFKLRVRSMLNFPGNIWLWLKTGTQDSTSVYGNKD